MKYIITEERLKQLLKRDELLNILEIAGVDNWYSFEQAAEMIGCKLPTDESLQIELDKFERYDNKI